MKRNLILITAILSLSLLFASCGAPKENTETPQQEAPKTEAAKVFEFEDYSGTTFKLSDFYGKPLVLNFWASWCPPCRSEMPHFNKAFLENGSFVNFVMLNMTDGSRETKAIAQSYIEENKFSFPIYFDTKSNGAMAYNIQSIPTTVFIDKDGNIVKTITGAIDETTLTKTIEALKQSAEQK